MNERSRNIIVGVTTLAGLIGLVLMLLIFGYVPSWLESGYVIRVELKSASGLSEGSRVRMNGIDIGRVVGVDLEDGKRGPVVMVRTLISSGKLVPQGVRVRAEMPLLGGSPALAFDASEINPLHPNFVELKKPLPTDGKALIIGETFTPLTELAEQFRLAMSEPSRSFDRLATSFERLSADWGEVARNVNHLLEPRKVSDVDSGNMVGNLATVIARTDNRLKELELTIQAANQWLADEKLREDVRQTAANSRQLTDRLNVAADKAVTLLDTANNSIDRLANRYIAAADDLSGAVHSLQDVLDQARRNEGTIGKLLRDPAIYDNLNDSAKRLNAALTEFRLLIEKWKKEGLPVQF